MCILLLGALVAAPALHAQTYRFRSFGIEEGLGNLAVTCIVQGPLGFLWVGTLNGLYRYDGERFERFGRAEGLQVSQVVSLVTTPNGDLLAATTNAVTVFRNGRFVPVSFGRPVTLRYQSSMAVEPGTSAVWVATDQGVATIDLSTSPGNPPIARFVAGIPRGDFSAVGFSGHDSVWLAGKQGLLHLAGGVLSRQGVRNGVPNDDWQALLADGEGTLWARSRTRVIALRAGHSKFSDETHALAATEFGALGLYPDGKIAVPTVLGLAVRAGDGWRSIGTRNGIPMESVSAVYFDREGSPWIGMNGGGVARWLGFGKWENWTAPAWLENDAAWSFAQGKGGEIWAGTNTGIVRFDGDAITGVSPPVRFARLKSAVRALALGPSGELFAGTATDGLYRCDTASKNCRPVTSHVQFPVINSITVDSRGRLWIAAENGLFSGDATRAVADLREEFLPGQPASQNMRKVTRGPNGELIIAGQSGLWVRHSGRGSPGRLWDDQWTHYGKSDGLLDGDLAGAAADPSGNIWVSYYRDLGVSRLNARTNVWQHFDQSNGLVSNWVYSLGIDAEQRVWVGTDQGIDSFQGNKWTHYSSADGLIWPDLNTDAWLADSNDGLWFGTSRGISRLTIARDSKPFPAPIPVVTHVQVNGRDQGNSRNISISSLNNDVTLHFSALSFRNEAGISFEYRLLGLQTEWQSSRDRSLHLLNLPSGQYVFELRARAAGGLSAKNATLSLTVETPWWRTPGFLLAAFALLTALARIIWRWRMKILLRKQRELELAVKDRTRSLLQEKERLVEAREAFAYQASHDSLTGLANRHSLHTGLTELLVTSTGVAVFWIDLDRFKAVNDMFGHAAGDEVLTTIARELRDAIGKNSLIARLGGDEFVAAFDCPCAAAAKEIARSVLERLEQPILLSAQPVTVTGSIGIAFYPDHGSDAGTLLRNADLAMYEAKRLGKNNFHAFCPGLAEDMEGVLGIQRQIQGALDREEMYVVYQPQVGADGAVEGAEALVRWINPTLGNVSPAAFIPIAEEHGLIAPVGEWVLRTACAQARVWHEAGHRLKMAVNVSVLQLVNPNFAGIVARILRETRFDPLFLELEITETAVMRDVTQCVRQMKELRDMGVKIAIDDFGVGNSSLNYLQLLPADSLKIDRSFVASLDQSENNRATMVRAIIGLARGLGLRVIAEGIETEIQARILKKESCDALQGYYFSRPVRPDALTELLQSRESSLLQPSIAPGPIPFVRAL